MLRAAKTIPNAALSPRWWRTGEYGAIALLLAVFCYAYTPDALGIHLNGSVKLVDFVIFYSAAQAALEHVPLAAYDFTVQETIQSQIIDAPIDMFLPYLYPPYSLAFFAPLTALAPMTAYYLWQWVGYGASLALIMLLRPLGVCQARGSLLLAAALLGLSLPWALSYASGQPTILMTLALLFALLWSGKRPWCAALVLILCAFKPPLLVAPVLYLAITSGRAFFDRLLILGLAVILGCSLVFGWHIWIDYVSLLLAMPDYFGSAYGMMEMANLRALAAWFLGEEHFDLLHDVSLWVWVGGVLFSLGFALQLHKQSPEKRELGFAIVLTLACVTSTYLYINSLVLLVIPLAIAVKHTGFRGIYPIILIALGGTLALQQKELYPLIWVSVQLGLLGWLIHLLRHSKRLLNPAP